MKHKLETMYLDYFNNFLTLDKFSEFYQLDTYTANRVLAIGRRLNHRKAK